jgi:hypothetical protein
VIKQLNEERPVDTATHHPAIRMKDPTRPPGRRCTDKILHATFTREQRKRVHAMLEGLKEVYGIDTAPVAENRSASKLCAIALIYPQDVLSLFLAAPKEKVVERLIARGIRWQFNEVANRCFLVVMWPIADFLQLVDVWHDWDAAGLTCMFFWPARDHLRHRPKPVDQTNSLRKENKERQGAGRNIPNVGEKRGRPRRRPPGRA